MLEDMSCIVEPKPVETLQFKWGTKRGRGGKKKEIQFYESFTYDNVEYTLYDTVYLYKEGELEPYIGKLIKIWENPDKAKKVKVHWFFRPSEMLNWIEKGVVVDKEIFLASGEGVGSANVNPLEAIAGKCNVVCTVKDARNPQPSVQEFELADYFFERTFDVQHCTISDLVGEKVAGLEVKFLFNRKENINNIGVVSVKKEEGENCSLPDTGKPGVASSSFQETLTVGKAANLCRDSENHEKEPTPSNAEVEDKLKFTEGASVLGSRLLGESGADGSENSFKNKNEKSMGMLNTNGNDTKLLKKSSSFNDKIPNISRNKPDSEGAVDADKSSGVSESRLPSRSVADGCETSCKNGSEDNVVSIGGNESKPFKKASSYNDIEINHRERPDFVGSDKVVKAAKDPSGTEDSPCKKLRVDNTVTKAEKKDNLQKLGATSDKNIGTDSVTPGGKRKPNDDSLGPDKGSQQQKTREKMIKLADGKLPKVEADEFVITPRPTDERSKWFRPPPWEERVKSSCEQGTLIQLSNLDSRYTSSEVEDIIWHAFKEHCTAKVMQRVAYSSPINGHAHIIVKTRATANIIIKKLEDGCLMLPNGRPLVASEAPPPNFPGKQSTFVGHLLIDKMKHQMLRDMREAVSTSHCSQPNTSEFEMALEWCLLQSKSDYWWKQLYKKQGEEIIKVKANLKREK